MNRIATSDSANKCSTCVLGQFCLPVGLNPEEALERTNKKFIRRFQFMEGKMQEQNLTWDQMKLESLDVFWNQAKKEGL